MLLYGIGMLIGFLLSKKLPLAHTVAIAYHDAHYWQGRLELHVGIACCHHLAHGLEGGWLGRAVCRSASSRHVGILACGDDGSVPGFG